MTSTLITDIAELVTNDAAHGGLLGILNDAAIVVDGEQVAWVGSQRNAPAADVTKSVNGRAVIPAFVDSHTHLVFGGDRSAEFTARMTGEAYDGGGIAVSMAATRAASDAELRALVQGRVQESTRQGTGTLEIKSGYGLTIDDECRALRIASAFTSETTFLGAHVVPPDRRSERASYVSEVCGPMLDACAPYARWIDVFCEPHSAFAFDEAESRAVLQAGLDAGLLARVHGNQLGHGPGVQLAVELDAASVDHCTYLSDADVDALAQSDTVATLLPGVEFSTRSPYPSGPRLLDAGVELALASDCNPGTCFSNSMPFMIALAVREMGLSPEQALYAATAGSAKSLRRNNIGHLGVGARADLTVLDAPTYLHLAYRPGVPIATRLTT